MDWVWNLLFLMAVAQSAQAQIQLVQSGPELKKPGESVKLSCRASGYTFTDYPMGWVKQAPGKGLQYMGWISTKTGKPTYTDDFKERFVFSVETSASTASLQIINLKNEDMATYFCLTIVGLFDYWGQGVMVTVSSESPREPSIYPLTPPPSPSSDPVSIGCLIQNYFPSGTVNVTWGKSGKDISVINFPPAPASGPYTMCSQLTLPAAECPPGASVKYSVQYNTNPVRELSVKCPTIEDPIILPCHPNLSLRRPALEDLLLGSEASLTCTLSGLKEPKGAVFTWQPTTGKDAVQKEPVKDSCGCYSVSSVLPGCAERWNKGETFTCTATHPEFETPLTGKITKVIENTLPPQVHLLPPPSEELALNELVSLTCLIRGFNPKDVLVRWLQGNEELPSESYLVFEPLKEPGEGAITYLVTSVLRVSAETWKQGAQYSCMVGHEALPMSFTQKTIDRLSECQEPPSYVILDQSQDILEEETPGASLWPTTVTFLTLFLLSLFYSTALTVTTVRGPFGSKEVPQY